MNLKSYYLIALLSCCVLGCASVKETARGIAGVSTKILEDGRKDALKQGFNYDYNICYNQLRQILIGQGSYIYAEDRNKGMIAVYLSEEDTTPVGIFFREIGPQTTLVEVSSPSGYAKELIMERIADALKK